MKIINNRIAMILSEAIQISENECITKWFKDNDNSKWSNQIKHILSTIEFKGIPYNTTIEQVNTEIAQYLNYLALETLSKKGK